METAVSTLQRRIWLAQRIGWGLVTLLLILTGLGAAGSDGPLNHRVARSLDGGIQIRYRPIQRVGVQVDLLWEIRSQPNDTVSIDLDSSFISALELKQVVPEPEQSVSMDHGGLRLRFATGTEEGPVHIRMSVSSRSLGRFTARASSAGQSVALTGIALP